MAKRVGGGATQIHDVNRCSTLKKTEWSIINGADKFNNEVCCEWKKMFNGREKERVNMKENGQEWKAKKKMEETSGWEREAKRGEEEEWLNNEWWWNSSILHHFSKTTVSLVT